MNMERKVLLASMFITLGAIAFLSGHLLIPERTKYQTGSFIQRFTNNLGVESPRSKGSTTLPISSRKFISFVGPFSISGDIIAVDVDGNVVRIDTDIFRENVVASLKYSNISEVFLSPNGNSVVYSFYNIENIKKYLYLNFKSNESAEISDGLRSVAFSPDGDQIAYLINNGDEGELLISKGVNIIRRALKTRLGATIIDWPQSYGGALRDSNFISILSYDKNGYGDLFILKDGNNLNKIISYQYDLSVKWSPSGEGIIFSNKNGMGSNHLFYKEFGGSEEVVDLGIGNASKCVWVRDNINVICGLTNQSYLKDEFYRINTSDGSRSPVAMPNINLITKDIAINQSGNHIFILNDIDDGLYSIEVD